MKRILILIAAAIFFSFGLNSIVIADEDLPSVQEINYKDFSNIDVSGSWDIDIKQGDKYKILVLAPQTLRKYVDLDKEGDVLRLKIKTRPWTWFKKTTDKVHAEITVPSLTKIEASGDVAVRFAGFKINIFNMDISGNSAITSENNKISNLFIEMSGNSTILCKGNRIENLSVESSGNTNLDFKASAVTNANLYLSGLSKAELKMNGGNLSGRIDGDSSITYSGKVKRQDISISGKAAVNKK